MEIFFALLSFCAGISRVTDEFPSHTKSSDAELWYFMGSAPEQTAR